MISVLHPYPTYKPSDAPWLSDVPEHWDVRRVKFFFREVHERSTTGSEELMSVSHKTGVTPRKQNVTMFLAESNVGYKVCRPGDIVINTMWAYMAALGVAWQEGLVSPSYGVYRPLHRRNLNPNYIDLLLRTEEYRTAYLAKSTGITDSRLRLYPESFLGIPLLCPSLAEQAAIVRYLDHTDEQIQRYIKAKERLIALLQEERQALVHQAVTRGLDPNVRLKDSRVEWLGDVPEHWEIAKLKFLCNRIQNGATPPTDEPRYYDNGTIPWYGPSSWTLKDEPTSPVRYLNTDAFDQGKARLIRNPALLVVVIGATSGRMGLLTRDGSTNQQITAFELDTTLVEPMFLLRQVGQCEHWLRATASTATIPILNSNIVSGLPVAVPPLSEQGAILERLTKGTDRLDAAISSAQSQVHLMNEYRTRLIADVVTGQLDVRGTATQLPAAP